MAGPVDNNGKNFPVYPISCDSRVVIIAVLKMFIILILLLLPSLWLKDMLLFTAGICAAAAWFVLDYLSHPRKIILQDDRLILHKWLGSSALHYSYIKSARPLAEVRLGLLQRYFPALIIWGRRGWYAAGKRENVFVYSLSSATDQQVLIRYGGDYFLLSIAGAEAFCDELLSLKESMKTQTAKLPEL